MEKDQNINNENQESSPKEVGPEDQINKDEKNT